MRAAAPTYDSLARSFEWRPLAGPAGAAFFVRPPTVPELAQPIIDDASGACVGFSLERTKGVWHIYDLSGLQVGIEESPLETPLVDPLDLLLVGVAFVRLIRGGIGAIATSAARRSSMVATHHLAQHVIPVLRERLRGLAASRLRFTETSAAHMTNPGRRVPIHILHLAIKFGRRARDPQGIVGVYRYEIPLVRLVRRGPAYVREVKTLEVVVREADWTILHFMYF